VKVEERVLVLMGWGGMRKEFLGRLCKKKKGGGRDVLTVSQRRGQRCRGKQIDKGKLGKGVQRIVESKTAVLSEAGEGKRGGPTRK